MARITLPTLAAFALPTLVGGAAGDALLDRANAPDAALAAALTRAASPREASPAPSGHLVLVVVDGVGEAFVDRGVRDGTLRPVTWSQPFDTGTPSLSRPGYHAFLTGVAQRVSRVMNNRYASRARADTVADRVRDAGGSVAWALESVDWMYTLTGAPGEPYLRGAASRDLVAVTDLARRHALTVVHWTRTDDAGHAYGARSDRYAREVRACFTLASRLHDRLAAALGPDGFTLLVGADHGHVARGGHGGPEPDVTRTRWVRLGGPSPRAPTLARQPQTALAATFTDALGLAPPRHAMACPVPLAGVASRADCRAIERRRAALDRAVAEVNASAARRARLALTSLGAVLAAVATRARREVVRHRTTRSLAALALLLAVAAAGFALLGPGWTLSAIRSKAAFVAHSLAVMAAGVAVAWPLARRVTRARTTHVAAATALVPLAAVAYATVTLPGDVGLLLAPAAGLFAAAAGAALGLWALAARTGWSRPSRRPTVTP